MEAEIGAWEPGKRLAWREPFAVIEFTLEPRGVKSGFPPSLSAKRR